MLQEGVDAWRKIAETLKLKNAKEAIFEFLRIEDYTMLQSQKYLIEHASDIASDNKDEKAIVPSQSAVATNYADRAPLD